jgi:selenide,water dikinase
MLPGYVSGFYSHEECHIDLYQLATFAQARLIHAEATNINIKVGHHV